MRHRNLAKPTPRCLARRCGGATPHDREALREAFEAYIEATEIPVEAEFAYH